MVAKARTPTGVAKVRALTCSTSRRTKRSTPTEVAKLRAPGRTLGAARRRCACACGISRCGH
eukprot:8594595-Alexandrium_andersonii.AAC.1